MDNLKRDFSVGSNPDETNFLQFQGLKNFSSHKSEQISNHVSSKKSQRLCFRMFRWMLKI